MEHWISLSKTSKDKIIEIFDELERANEDIVLDASDIRQLLDASCAGQRLVKTSVNIIAKASRVILNTLLMQEAEVRSLQLVDAKITLPAICYETTYKLEAYEKTKYNVIVTVFAPVNIVVAPDIGATQLCKYLRHPGDECALAFKNVDFSKLHSFGAFFHDMMLGDLVMDNCDISNIDDMSDMFLGCFALENVRINNFNIAERNGKKINMEYFLGSNSPVNPYKRESCLKHVDLGDLTPEIIEESIKPVIDWPLDFEVDDINKMLKASETTKKYLIDKWRQDRDSKDIRNGSIVKKGFTNLPYSLTIRQDICKLAKFRVAEIIECKILQYETVVQLALLSTENVTCRINNILQRTPDQDQLEYKDVEVGKYAPTFFDRYMINGGVKALMKVPPLFIFDSSALEDYLITKVVYSQAYIVEKVELIISNQFDIEQLINILFTIKK